MITPNTAKMDSMLRKVQALLANADDPGNTPEAQASYRAKAEALMFQYRVDENQLAAAGGQASGIAPVWRTIFVSRHANEFRMAYFYMAVAAVNHVGAKHMSDSARNPDDDNRWWDTLEVVGYESDLRYAELLITSMHLGFASKMEPKVDPGKSDAENAYVLRSAGLEGRRIAMLLWGKDDKPLRVKARKLFAQHATSLGEDPSVLLGRGNAVSTFRESYADGFENEMRHRLQRMRISTGDSGELVLKNRGEAVQEAYYEKYPYMRPGTSSDRAIGNPKRDCERCEKAKSGYCRQHSYLRPRAARYVERAYSSAGDARGRAAARSVDLGSAGTGRVSGSSARALG